MEVIPIPNSRALRIKSGGTTSLVVGDLHLGISAELAEKGIEIQSQVEKTQERLMELIRKEKAERLFFLGDVKHNIPVTSMQEWEDLPRLFSNLSEVVKVEVVQGNHDGDIGGLVTRDVSLHPTSGTTVYDGRVGLIHGHAWPEPSLLKAEKIVMGHNHPTIEFKDELGARITEPAWIRTKIKPENLPERLREKVEGEGPEVIVVPAFSELIGGSPVNREIPEKLLGPMFEADAVDLDGAEIFLLDGTFLGKLENLRSLAKRQKSGSKQE